MRCRPSFHPTKKHTSCQSFHQPTKVASWCDPSNAEGAPSTPPHPHPPPSPPAIVSPLPHPPFPPPSPPHRRHFRQSQALGRRALRPVRPPRLHGGARALLRTTPAHTSTSRQFDIICSTRSLSVLFPNSLVSLLELQQVSPPPFTPHSPFLCVRVVFASRSTV